MNESSFYQYLFSLRTEKERATDSQNTKYKLSDISIPGCPGLRVAGGCCCCWALGEENNIDNIVSLPSAAQRTPGSSNCRGYECAGQETIGALAHLMMTSGITAHSINIPHTAYLCHPWLMQQIGKWFVIFPQLTICTCCLPLDVSTQNLENSANI